MALGATIYKIELNVADTDRHYYASHTLTVARHPSETVERLMVRLLAFSMHAHEDLAFTKGISDSDEPDLWLKDLTGTIDLWVEVGQPSHTRIMKACGRAKQVVVYCHAGHASKVWWEGIRSKVERAKNLQVVDLPATSVSALAHGISRSMVLHVTRQEGDLLVSTSSGQAGVIQTAQYWPIETSTR